MEFQNRRMDSGDAERPAQGHVAYRRRGAFGWFFSCAHFAIKVA